MGRKIAFIGKKYFCFFILSGLLLVSCSNDEPKYNFEQLFRYNIVDNEIEITKAPSLETVTIPSSVEIDGVVYPVTKIGQNAFDCNPVVETLYIPESINTIGKHAFRNTNIKNLHIKDLVSWCNIEFNHDSYYTKYFSYWIYYSPFNNDTKFYVNGELIEDMVIPEGITEINSGVFVGLNCRSVTIGNDVKIIGSYAFYDCRIDEIFLGKRVTEIYEDALNGEIKRISFQRNITTPLNKTLMSGALERINVPSLDVWLGMKFETKPNYDAYWGFDGSFGVSLYDMYIGGERMDYLEIPEGIEELQPLCFSRCNIKGVTFPSSLKRIGDAAFGSSGLESVTIPDNLDGILKSTFRYCESLKSVHIAGNLPGNTYIFQGCPVLEEITYTDRFDNMGTGMFYGCTGLKEFAVPEGETGLASLTFSDCISLEKVILPSTLTDAGWMTFFGCDNLREIEFRSTTPPGAYKEELDGLFASISDIIVEKCTLYVPEGCVKAYRQSPIWGKFHNIREINSRINESNSTFY